MIEVEQGECIVENKQDNSRKFEPKLKRIDFCDTRVYRRSENEYYPSVTNILSYAPMDPFLVGWFKQLGANADIVKRQAGYEGTQVHEAMEKFVAGEKVEWQDMYGNAKYNLQVWKMILRGADFFNTYQPKILGSEQFLFSDKYKYAGTMDLLVEIENQGKTEKWLLDFKTSNHVNVTYFMQLAAYSKALEEQKGIKVDRTGVLWLKAATRTHSKKEGVFQGEGWQILFSGDIDKDFSAFLNIYDIFKLYNSKIEPLTKSYPTEIQFDKKH